MKINCLLIPILLAVLTPLYGFGQSLNAYNDPTERLDNISNIQIPQKESPIESVIHFGESLIGLPYKYKVIEDNLSLDCSGFIRYIFQHQGVLVPRSSRELKSIAKKVTLKDLKKGDLMFFKGRNKKQNQVRHVSIVTDVKGDQIEMMHSCNRGIIVENYNRNSYYTSRFICFGRLPQIEDYKKKLGAAHPNQILDIIKDTIVTPTDTTSKDSLPPLSDADLLIRKQQKELIQHILSQLPAPKSLLASYRIMGVGDMMLGTNFPSSKHLPPNDGKDILSDVKGILQSADVTFGNLEGGFLTGEGNVKKCSNPETCYAFKMPDHYVNYFVDAGFDVLSIANNHVNDFGSVGTKNTMRVLNESGIAYAGLEDCPFTTFEKNGIKYGFVAFAPNTGTIRINDYDNARKIIHHLDSISDIVIVSFHGGAEGSTKRNITRENEIFLGENRGNPYEFARMAIDAGGDIIFGHGPHVTRGVDLYKNRFIAYSLGNFATYGRFNLSGPNGIAPIMEVTVDKYGQFIKGKITSIQQKGEGGPQLDPNQRVVQEIKTLTQEDLPESSLLVDDNGVIGRK